MVASQRLLFMAVFRFPATEVQSAEELESPAQVAIWAPVAKALYKSIFASVLYKAN